MFWTDERDSILREMAAIPGVSCNDIAGELSHRLGVTVTRNAVIGRAARLGIKTQQRQGEATDQKIKQERKPLIRAPDQPPPALRADPVGPQRLKTIIELDPHECRWPIGGWPDNTPVLFCGKTRCEASPYCSGHTNLGTQRQ